MTLTTLEPQLVWKYFSELSAIPRESGNEAGVRAWLLSIAKQHHINAATDGTGNVIFTAPATDGYQHLPSVALQGHMDMVCVKTAHSNHDFTKDPIQLVLDGDKLSAKDTSLGGDNGIALAMILAIFTDEHIPHGPLQAIFTVDEEVGMVGAFGLEPSLITSKLLINLDSEEEGVIYIGCAGGAEVQGVAPLRYEVQPTAQTWTVHVSGLLGGHSGGEIHLQRGNAIKIAVRLLLEAAKITPIRLVSINGGTKRNVIPSECTAVFCAPAPSGAAIKAICSSLKQAIQTELSISDPHVRIDITTCDEHPAQSLSEAQTNDILNSLHTAPHGVEAMTLSMNGVVQTSSNLASVHMDHHELRIIASQRSSVLSQRDDCIDRTITVFQRCGCSCKVENPYPAWAPNPDSPLVGFCAKAYEAYTGTPATITAIHAGLECGVINSKFPGMDSVSFGPNLYAVHSTEEWLSVSSVERIFGFLKHLLTIIK